MRITINKKEFAKFLMMSWTNDTILDFIELYKKERILWDPKHSQNRNRGEVSVAWMRIQSSLNMNFSIVDLKKKKESLMTSFRFHFNRRKKNPNYRITWFPYAAMETFLNDKYERDSTNELESEFFSNTQTYTHSPMNTDPIACRNTTSPEKSNTVIKKSRPKPYSNKQSMVHQTEESLLRSKDSNDDNTNANEYELYGQLLAKKLRKLDEHQRDIAMHEIDNIMFRAKMQCASSQARSYPTSTSPIPRKMKSPIFIVTQQNHTQYEDENIAYPEHMQPTSS